MGSSRYRPSLGSKAASDGGVETFPGEISLKDEVVEDFVSCRALNIRENIPGRNVIAYASQTLECMSYRFLVLVVLA